MMAAHMHAHSEHTQNCTDEQMSVYCSFDYEHEKRQREL